MKKLVEAMGKECGRLEEVTDELLEKTKTALIEATDESHVSTKRRKIEYVFY